MKKLVLIATICITLGLLCVLVPSLVFAQPTWESYRDPEPPNTVWGDVGTEYNADYHIVYMWGDYFTKNTDHKVAYYDGGGIQKAIDSVPVLGNEELPSQYDLTTDPAAQEGTWHAVVYLATYDPPSTYDPETPGDPPKEADDSFEVLPSAIPEFPTVITAIGVVGLCFGIYYWMRKKRLVYVKA